MVSISKKVFNLNNNFYFNFTYYNDKIKNLKNFVIERKYIGKFGKNKVLFPSWKNVCNKYLTDIGFYKKFYHPQDITEGYTTNNLSSRLKLVIVRGFTHNQYFEDFYKPNIFIKKNFENGTHTHNSYLNVRNFGVCVESINVLKKRKSGDYNDLVESINNDNYLQDKFYLDLEEKVDIITENENIMNSITSEEKFIITQHLENCVNKIDHTCLQCISIENKYGIVKVTSELIKIKYGF